ncbi:alpha-beta hydrolase superfamily lysophospholipase [Paenibacillus amylolyticus]|uniref:Alpha-beta hydrolase superfamily lysophospholipase n=1 Tax=Paenibacillus amylolyticus TaxID=1451 RepID=A0AAP5H6Q4_PAEAM|nr:alpha/beta fold hydrolase [Paenibacillus amylolyticus]MDR6726827.1 alpha-beta hydrolase superfamily lysophospholipase [Paenibacillus amylolyticus]
MSTAFELPTGDNSVIRGNRFLARQSAQGVIIVVHGYKGFKDWGMFPYAASQLSENYHVLTFNFSHNGVGEDLQQFTELEKFAVNTYSQELSDLALILEYVSTQPELGNLPIYLVGHSRGAGVSLVYALDHPEQIAGVCSWNGVTNLDLFTAEQKEEMRTHGRSYVTNGRTGQQMPLDVLILDDLDQHKARYAIIERLTQSTLPVVLIQGTEDSARLREGSSTLVQARHDIPWLQIPGGTHTFNTVHPFQETTPQLEQAISETRRQIDEWNHSK